MKVNSLSKEEWNQPLPGKAGDFLQSWGWGALKESRGRQVFRFAEDKGNSFFRAQIIKKHLWKNKSFFYCPRGPVGLEKKRGTSDVLKKFIKSASKQAKKVDACFLRAELPYESDKPHIEPPAFLEKQGFLKAPRSHQPVDTLVKDISGSSEEILAGFKSKTRYNIRLAKRKGVKIRRLKREEEFEDFYALLKNLSQAKDFGILKKEHYKNLFELSREKKDRNGLQIVFLGAFHEKNLIGAVIGVCFHGRGYYLHGANDYEKRELMGSYLLQWALINELKKLGAKSYDLWGVIREEKFSSKEAYKQDDWYGITRFKEKFGGAKKSYLGAYDSAFQPSFYKAYRFYRKIKHGLGN
jgi:lipid II:glycine glycyltransferase (peptidoglycan interpeptide bridge formation enzyme)